MSAAHSPAVADETVGLLYIPSGQTIFALNMSTGSTVWTVPFEGLSYEEHRPVATQGKLFVSAASTLYAFAAVGELLWKYSAFQASLASDQTSLYLCNVNGGPVISLEMLTGKVRWSYTGEYCSSVVSWNGMVLARCGPPGGYWGTGFILGLSAWTGSVAFNHTAINTMSGIAVSDAGVAYYQRHHLTDTELVAIDAFQGQVVYNYSFTNSDGAMLAATSKNAVYVTTDMNLYAFPLTN
jgi:outer membrane protein assembly factor BamB